MTKPVLTTLSLSFLMLRASAVASATEQAPLLHLASSPIENGRFGCSSQAEIERGWEAQQQLLDERLAARAATGVLIPGTILSPPLPDFNGSRAEASAKNTRKAEPAVIAIRVNRL